MALNRPKTHALSQYKNVWQVVARYWSLYGGSRAILKSPYFHLATAVTIASHSIWTAPTWWDIPVAVLPNLVGFTLGGYAMLTAFGDENFRGALFGSNKSGDTSPFMALNSTFVHFIVTQIVAIIVALLAKSRPLQNLPDSFLEYINLTIPCFDSVRYWAGHAFWFFGYLIFIYAITLTLAATLSIFRMARWYEISKRLEDDGKGDGRA